MSKQKKQRKPKMREADRLVRNIAEVMEEIAPTQAEREKAVRKNLHLASIQNQKSEVEVLRDMWAKLNAGQPHRQMNEMIAKGYMRKKSFESFEVDKGILRMWQRRARKWTKEKQELSNDAERVVKN